MAELSIRCGAGAGRALLQLRVRPGDAARAAAALGLPTVPLQSRPGDPAALWTGPGQWLLIGNSQPVAMLLARCEAALGDTLHLAADATDALDCIAVEGGAARRLLGMHCGLDLHPASFTAGCCARTRMAGVAAIVWSPDNERFELFVERSVSRHLEDWLWRSAEDPLLRRRGSGAAQPGAT